MEELGETLSSGLKEILSGKSKAIAQQCRGSGIGVESSKLERSVWGHGHARNARDAATGESRKEGAIGNTSLSQSHFTLSCPSRW